MTRKEAVPVKTNPAFIARTHGLNRTMNPLHPSDFRAVRVFRGQVFCMDLAWVRKPGLKF
jgi:hypothetical protein